MPITPDAQSALELAWTDDSCPICGDWPGFCDHTPADVPPSPAPASHASSPVTVHTFSTPAATAPSTQDRNQAPDTSRQLTALLASWEAHACTTFQAGVQTAHARFDALLPLAGRLAALDATARLEAQSVQLSALPPPNMPGGLARDLFAQMDATLEAELDRMERAPAPAPVVAPPPPRFHRVSRVGLAAYATLLGAALAWGWWSHEVAADALVREQAMRMELERAERLRAMPVPLPQDTQQYRTVAHSRGRGHL
mgnify:CR=1 FL=1